MATIDFWFSIGSTCSYLTVMRLPSLTKASGIKFRWRPCNIRHVIIKQNNVPFTDKPVKTAYMWRDIELEGRQLALNDFGWRATRSSQSTGW